MIPFTQYMRPNGRKVPCEIERPEEIEKEAHRFIQAGGVFESEVLRTGDFSFTAQYEGQDIAIVLVFAAEIGEARRQGGYQQLVEASVDKLVKDACQWYDNHQEAAYDRQQTKLMEDGPGKSLQEQQAEARKLK